MLRCSWPLENAGLPTGMVLLCGAGGAGAVLCWCCMVLKVYGAGDVWCWCRIVLYGGVIERDKMDQTPPKKHCKPLDSKSLLHADSKTVFVMDH